MKHMKKNLTLFGAAFLASLTLGACGKNNEAQKEDPSQNQTQTEVTPTKPLVNEGEKKWPEADFITEDMKYTGKGEIVYTEYVDGKEDGNQDCSWTIYYKDAELNDVKKYIESLKNKGFKYAGDKEPTIEFKNGMFSWAGKTNDGKHFISLYIADHNDFATVGSRQENIEQNMYINISNYDLSAAINNDLTDDDMVDMPDEENENK